MFKVYFINFWYYSDQTGATLDEALAIGKKAGFEFAVHHNDQVVAAWSPIGGTRYYR
jgi:hypothetical protein